MSARLAPALAAMTLLTLIDKAVTQATRQFFGGRLAIVSVIAFMFASEHGVQHIVAVVIPLGIKTGLAWLGAQQRGAVVLVFQYQMHMALTGGAAHALSEFEQEAFVINGVHGVEAQAIHTVVEHPHKRIFTEEIPHRLAPEINTGAPRCMDVF